jgi:hypothetical protein
MKILGTPDEFIVTGVFLKVLFRLECSNAGYMKNPKPVRRALPLCGRKAADNRRTENKEFI